MNSFAFDTHAFVKRLTQSGMNEEQAEAVVECQKQLANDSLATRRDVEEVKVNIEEIKADIEALRLATKQSIEKVKGEVEKLKVELEQVKVEVEQVKVELEKVKGEVEKLRLEMKKDIKELELRLTLRLASVIVVTMGIFATLVKFLP